MIGKRLAYYQIIEKLGEGGMGVVYKAVDQRLKRPVALKVLPPEKVSDPELVGRFVQEARAASALNHPNIVTIYDIGEAEGAHYIAMEYVDGKTLNSLIAGKGMPLGEALAYALQIADAVGKAHGAGIVHRDLKPSNVMVTTEGVVKILDFGLAKLFETTTVIGEDAVTMTVANAPVTRQGVIVGTVAYMSPEQAEGKAVDQRSDIFSFGAMLYEMLAGRRPFTGDTYASTLAAVIAREPAPLTEAVAGLPVELERVIQRCLRKDPDRRWQTMADLKGMLQDLKEESGPGRSSTVARPAARRHSVAWWAAVTVGITALLAAGGVTAWWYLRQSALPAASFELERITFETGAAVTPAISADGKLMAYSSDRGGTFDIYVRQLNGTESIQLTKHEANDGWPCFFPDGSKIVFRSERDGGGLYVVETLGGVERRIADGGRMPAVSPDGSTVAYLGPAALSTHPKFFLVPANGGPPRVFAPGLVSTRVRPIWSPDGKYLLVAAMQNGQPGSGRENWWIGAASGGDPSAVGTPSRGGRPGGIRPVAWRPGYIYYVQGSAFTGMSLYRIRLSENPWRLSGSAQRIAALQGLENATSVAGDGRLLLSLLTPVTNIWSVALSPGAGTASGALQPVTSDGTAKSEIAAASGGARLAFTTVASSKSEIRVRDLDGGGEHVISGVGSLGYPRLSSDGSRLAYWQRSGGKSAAMLTEPGSASARSIVNDCVVQGLLSSSAEALLDCGNKLERLELSSGRRTQLLQIKDGSWLEDVALSPSDRWMAFTLARPEGTAAMFVAPTTAEAMEPSGWVQVAADPIALGSPAWSRDSRLLYYACWRDSFLCVWARRFGGDGKPVGEPFAVEHLHTPPSPAAAEMLFLSVAGSRLFLLIPEAKGNVWSIKLEK